MGDHMAMAIAGAFAIEAQFDGGANEGIEAVGAEAGLHREENVGGEMTQLLFGAPPCARAFGFINEDEVHVLNEGGEQFMACGCGDPVQGGMRKVLL